MADRDSFFEGCSQHCARAGKLGFKKNRSNVQFLLNLPEVAIYLYSGLEQPGLLLGVPYHGYSQSLPNFSITTKWHHPLPYQFQPCRSRGSRMRRKKQKKKVDPTHGEFLRPALGQTAGRVYQMKQEAKPYFLGLQSL